MDFVKVLRLKPMAIALAGIWVIVLVAAVTGTIYRDIDGPTLRSTLAENMGLAAANYSLNERLNSAQHDTEVANGVIDQLEADLIAAQWDHYTLNRRLESYLSSTPLMALIGPKPPGSLETRPLP